GICGTGEDATWQRTRFCLGGVADVMWGRRAETEPGAGGYFQISTAGFRDVRPSLGVTGIVSLLDWFTLSARAGGLARLGGSGARPGAEGYLELGHRSVSHRSRYALSNALFGGVQWVAATSSRDYAERTIWIGLRLDGVWLTAPRF